MIVDQNLKWFAASGDQPDVTVRRVSRLPRICGEGVRVLRDGHTLAEVDIVGQSVHLTDLANIEGGPFFGRTFDKQTGGVDHVPTSIQVRGIANEDLLGRLLVGAGSEIHAVDYRTGWSDVVLDLGLPSGQQINELLLDLGLRKDDVPVVWIMTKSNEKDADGRRKPVAGAYSWNLKTGQVMQVDSGLGNGNGVAVHPTRRILRWSCTTARTLWEADINPDGSLGEKSVIHQYASGSPDGGVYLPNGYLQAVNREGWLAWFPHGFQPGVDQPGRLQAPMLQVTKPAQGRRRGQIILSSANEGMDEAALAADPLAGYTVELTVEGSGVGLLWG